MPASRTRMKLVSVIGEKSVTQSRKDAKLCTVVFSRAMGECPLPLLCAFAPLRDIPALDS